MTDITSTPPALRWIALFLAACAVLGLFLGFRDQIRKNPPGWYTGAEQIATPLAPASDGAREAVPFDPDTPTPLAPPSPAATTTPLAKAPETTTAPLPDAAAPAGPTAHKPVVSSPAVTKPRVVAPAPRTTATGDPVGDILEGQKQTETPVTVPY